MMGKFAEGAIEKYDKEDRDKEGRNDFLAWFRKEGEKSSERMSPRDLMNHLVNNL
jgi:hypothetical protein